MLDDDSPNGDRPWITRPWPLAMLAAAVVLAAGTTYLAVTSPSDPNAATDLPAGRQIDVTQSQVPGPARDAADGPSDREPVASVPPPATTTTPPAEQQSVATETVPAGDPSVCGLPPGDQTIPVTPPTVDTWQLVGGQAVPYSTVFGPAVVDELGIGDCYAHSPTGAVFAAVNTVAALNLPIDRSNPLVVMDRRVAKGGDVYDTVRAQAEADVAAAKGRMPSETASAARMALLGFTVTDYTTQRAVLNLAVALGDPARPENYRQALMPVAMVWRGGDWKLVYTQAMASPQPIVSAGQYIEWTP